MEIVQFNPLDLDTPINTWGAGTEAARGFCYDGRAFWAGTRKSALVSTIRIVGNSKYEGNKISTPPPFGKQSTAIGLEYLGAGRFAILCANGLIPAPDYPFLCFGRVVKGATFASTATIDVPEAWLYPYQTFGDICSDGRYIYYWDAKSFVWGRRKLSNPTINEAAFAGSGSDAGIGICFDGKYFYTIEVIWASTPNASPIGNKWYIYKYSANGQILGQSSPRVVDGITIKQAYSLATDGKYLYVSQDLVGP